MENFASVNALPAAARLAAYGVEHGERLPHGMLYLESSSQAKTGDVPQTYSARTSCPADCPLKKGCYAAAGHCALVLKRCDSSESDKKGVVTFGQLARKVDESRAAGRDLIRHGVSGDIAAPGSNVLDRRYLKRLCAAYAGLAYGYTHCVQCEEDDRALKEAAERGFVLSYSCETEAEADRAIAHGIPAVIVWPKGKAIVVFEAHGATRVVSRALEEAQKAPRKIIHR